MLNNAQRFHDCKMECIRNLGHPSFSESRLGQNSVYLKGRQLHGYSKHSETIYLLLIVCVCFTILVTFDFKISSSKLYENIFKILHVSCFIENNFFSDNIPDNSFTSL